MRLIELFESRQAPLFHFMDYDKAEVVFRTDEMHDNWEHDIPGLGRVTGNSFTRNARYNHNRIIRLTMNQDRLAQNYKVIPLDGERIFRASHKMNVGISRDRVMNSDHQPIAEEFVIGPIKFLHKYISLLEITEEGTWLSGSHMLDTVEDATAYCTKFSIPLHVHPKFVKAIEELKRNRAEYDDEDDEQFQAA